MTSLIAGSFWSAESTCRGAAYNSSRFQARAGLGMLEASRPGGKIPMLTSAQSSRPQQGTKRRCPDCGSALIKRSSSSEHLLMSKTLLVCKNAVCGATFTGVDEITHRLSPPSWPNPEIQLPHAPSAIRRGIHRERDLPTHEDHPPALSQPQNESEVRP